MAHRARAHFKVSKIIATTLLDGMFVQVTDNGSSIHMHEWRRHTVTRSEASFLGEQK